MKIQKTSLPGVLLIKPDVFGDNRGYFLETYNRDRYAKAGLDVQFLQDNCSHSEKDVIRGLHYQLNHPQGKLVMVAQGEIFDVAVDIRINSPTFAKWTAEILSEENHHQLYIPEGFAHGFCVLSDEAHVLYKCTDLYTPGDDHGIVWSDPAIAIHWPCKEATLSEKDAFNPTLADIPHANLPRYR